MDINTALLAVLAVSLLLNALLAWRQGGMLPPEVVQMIFAIAQREANKTPAQWDNKAVEQLEELFYRLQGQGHGDNNE